MRIGGIIHELTHRPLAVEGQQHALGATAGLAFYDPVTRHPGDEVLVTRCWPALTSRWCRANAWRKAAGTVEASRGGEVEHSL